MSLYEKIVSKQEKLALVGLGYVGMPIAVAFAKKVKDGEAIRKRDIFCFKMECDIIKLAVYRTT